jgi:hypothetical protein
MSASPELITRQNASTLSLKELIERFKHLARLMHTTAQVNKEHLGTMSFKDLVDFINSKPAIKSTYDFLNALHACCVIWHKPSCVLVFRVQRFLSAFAISMYPKRLFQDDKTAEAIAVFDAANTLLDQVESIKRILIYGGDGLFEQTKTFLDNMQDYLAKYDSWKAADEVLIVRTIKNFLFRMQWGIFHIAGEHGEIDAGHPGVIRLKGQMDRLMTRLVQIKGINEAFLFNKEVEANVEQRRRLRLLREEQRRHAEGGFDFVEEAQ